MRGGVLGGVCGGGTAAPNVDTALLRLVSFAATLLGFSTATAISPACWPIMPVE